MAITEMTQARLFTFRVPSLEADFAIAMPEMLEIAPIGQITPVPFAPAYVIGAALWRGEVVTVIDLVSALTDDTSERHLSPDQAYLMCIVVLGDEAHLAAIPAMAGSTLIDVPRYVSRAEAPPAITNLAP